jgi:hypothetical protein
MGLTVPRLGCWGQLAVLALAVLLQQQLCLLQQRQCLLKQEEAPATAALQAPAAAGVLAQRSQHCMLCQLGPAWVLLLRLLAVLVVCWGARVLAVLMTAKQRCLVMAVLMLASVHEQVAAGHSWLLQAEGLNREHLLAADLLFLCTC